MKKVLLIVLLLVISNLSLLATDKYQRVKIYFDGRNPIELGKLGIDLTEGEFRQGVSFTGEINDRELDKIRSNGFRLEVLIEDLKQYYTDHSQTASQEKTLVNGCLGTNTPSYATPANFSYGSMGGFYTYSEMMVILDSMVAKYPNLISLKQPIDTTHTFEGRLIYYVKISDNPNIQEAEPHVLYSAIHHAREPIGMSQMIFYMWYLLENYNNSSAVQAIVNNTELYFVTCVNPDGYIYNETTDPQGGGFWRKNRRDNLDGTFGVDLNRNYGYQWGADDIGSSPDGFAETYRGTAPFSEPETRAMKRFSDSIHFAMALNYHSYGNLLIYPWGYIANYYTPDSARYATYGALLTKYNNFLEGTANQTVHYLVNGGSDDWMYGDQLSKPKIFAMTPEVGDGNQGFWPVQADIIPLCNNTMFSNMTLAYLAGAYANVEDQSPLNISSISDNEYYNIRSIGLDTTGTFTVSATAISANIVSIGSPNIYSGISTLSIINDSLSLQLSSAISPGDEVKYILSVSNGLFSINDTITRIYGLPTVVVSENGSTLSNWSNTGSIWGTDNTYFVSPSTSIADSPFGLYQSNANSELLLNNSINLTTAVSASISFYARWEIEADYDFAQLSASTDNGATWIPVCGKYTVPGSINQDFDNPVYDGFQTSWVKEEASLNDFLGQSILLRFRLLSDGFQEYDGFYFDDLAISKIDATAINENQDVDNHFSLTPNPVTNTLFVNGKNIYSVSILTLAGQNILESKTNERLFNLTELPAGMYLCQVQFINGMVQSSKFVKTNGR